jgi:selenocysteine lyase/cysteine desulfurase
MATNLSELEQRIYTALGTYSNVHRGSGHNSEVTTRLFEEAREGIMEYLGLKKGRYLVIFCSPRRAAELTAGLGPDSYKMLSSRDIGLPLGIRAVAVKKNALPRGNPFESGGGTTRIMGPDRVIWAVGEDKFEAGTPSIVSCIAFAGALKLMKKQGKETFLDPAAERIAASDILYHDELEKFSGRELLSELRKTLIGKDKVVSTPEGEKPFINFDNSASTPTFEPVWKAVNQTLGQGDQVQREIVDKVRTVCAGFLGAPAADYDLIFTSNTTEGINMAAQSLDRESWDGAEPVVLSTMLEHSSNDLPWRMIPGCKVIRLAIDDDGIIDLNEMETHLCAYNQKHQFGSKRIMMVAVSGASNVLGVCNDLPKISRIVHLYGARLLVDAAQLVAHRRVDMEASGIDYLAFSAHKVYAPFGSGALLVKKGLLNFTSPELGLIHSSGEENAAGIAAMGKALILLQRIGMDVIREEEQSLTAYALREMSAVPGIRIYGIKDPGSPLFARKGGVIVFSKKGLFSNKLAKEIARHGIGLRYGCHCAHILIKHMLGVGPKLQSFQYMLLTLFPKIRLPGLARISFGLQNTKEEVDTLIRILKSIR